MHTDRRDALASVAHSDYNFVGGPVPTNAVPLVGDWNGDRYHSVGFYFPCEGREAMPPVPTLTASGQFGCCVPSNNVTGSSDPSRPPYIASLAVCGGFGNPAELEQPISVTASDGPYPVTLVAVETMPDGTQVPLVTSGNSVVLNPRANGYGYEEVDVHAVAHSLANDDDALIDALAGEVEETTSGGYIVVEFAIGPC